MKRILLLLVTILLLTGCNNKEVKKEKQITKNNEMLSYTIDGEKTDIKPSKEEGYIVNKIICDNGSDMMWDNDNWEVELTKINSKDRCKIDFTKDTNTQGYRVTVTSNNTSSLDSLSKATTENGTVIIYSKSKIESVIGCNGVIEDDKVLVSNITSNQTCDIIVEQTLADAIKKAYPPQPGRTDFSKVHNGAPTLYTDIDNQGTTYYFSGDGANMNNWVSFAGKMWRIIRINGNGSIRLLYAGSGGEDGYIGSRQSYNDSYVGPYYVGFSYNVNSSDGRGNTTKSEVYKTLENWYNELDNNYKNYITRNIYCNDRSLASGNSYSLTEAFNYAGYERFRSNKKPTFKCDNYLDMFFDFGLMTADELVYAGGLFNSDESKAFYSLNMLGTEPTGSLGWWTMTPSYWSGEYAKVFYVINSKFVDFGDVYYQKHLVRPVISLKKEVLVTGGDGSGDNPYTVTLP